VLSSFDEIKLGVAYKVDGERLPFFPANLEVLGKVEVEYETMPGWKSDISSARTFEVRTRTHDMANATACRRRRW
jgi:adenylosuccinate synthase